MAEERRQTTLVDLWITRLKNHPLLAAICVFGIILAGIASFTESVSKLKTFFVNDPPKPTPVIVQFPQVPSQPQKRVHFREDFELGEKDTFVSNHGVSVATKYIMSIAGEGIVAQIGVSANGPIKWVDRVRKGKQFELHRSDCDSLMVLIKDIQFTLPKELTMDQLTQMGPVAEALVTRKVIGVVTGKCEE